MLGHELGHVAANHVYEQQAHALAARATGSHSIKRDSFSAAFTHEQEEEADMVGALYAALAGYDPYAASRLWKRRFEANGNTSGRLSDHPIYLERMARTEELADAFKQYYQAGEINPDHAMILQNNEVSGQAPEDMSTPAPGKGGGLLAALDVTLQSFAQHAEAKAEAQRQQSRVRMISLVQGSISYIEAKPIDDKRVSIWLEYRGNLPLSDLALLIEKDGKTALSEPLGIVRPRSRFQADFTFDDLNVLEANWDTVGFAVDHAEWGY